MHAVKKRYAPYHKIFFFQYNYEFNQYNTSPAPRNNWKYLRMQGIYNKTATRLKPIIWRP